MTKQEELDLMLSQFKYLTEEGKLIAAESLLDFILSGNAIGVFLNPATGEKINIKESIDAGTPRKKIITILINMLEISSKEAGIHNIINNLSASGEEEARKIVSELNTNKRPVYNQSNTKSESTIDNIIKSVIELKEEIVELTDEVQYRIDIVEYTVNIIRFFQEEIGYDPEIFDMLNSVFLVSLVSQVYNESSDLSVYKDLEPDSIMAVVDTVSENILNAYEETYGKSTSTDLLVAGLLGLATNLSIEKPQEFIPSDIIANHFGFDEDNECTCE